MKNLIMEHYRRPRNVADLSYLSQDHQYENPSCGDWIRIKPVCEEGIVTKIEFQAEGCSLSIAAASMLSEYLKDRTLEQARSFARQFIDYIRNQSSDLSEEDLGDLANFDEIRSFPIRQRCVILPFDAFLKETEDLSE